MAKELNISLGIAGLTTVKARRYLAGVLTGSDIAMAEVGVTGFYTGDMAGAAGTYQVLFFVGAETIPRGSGPIIWNGTAEVGPGGGAGSGAIEWDYTLTSSVNGAPIADVDVWVTTDAAGLNVIASGRTDQNGVVTFMLDAGQIYVWRQRSGFNFVNPDTEVVA